MIQRLRTLIAAVVFTMMPASVFAQSGGPGNMGSGGGMMDCVGGGMGLMMLFPMLIATLFIALLVMGIIALAKYIRQG